MLNVAFLSKTIYRLQRLSRQLWIRSSLIALLALVSAVLSPVLSPLVPDGLADKVGPEPVVRILQILASSMLAVTTFSLSVMVSARQSASSQATPRAHQLLLEDHTTQTVLATFLGAFVYGLASLILVSIHLYTQKDVVVILAFTLLVIGLVVVAILRWIEHLSELGSVVTTTGWIEDAAKDALETRINWPCLGARPLSSTQREIPARAQRVLARETGYVQHMDLASLNAAAAKANAQVFVLGGAGKFVTDGDPVAWFTGQQDADAIWRAFSVGRTRNFDQDPRFAVIVLSEIAQRALSPGINDPGTAIDIIGRLTRLLIPFQSEAVAQVHDEVRFPQVWIKPVTADALLRDAFGPIARAGASTVEVQIRLQKALARLAQSSDPEMASAARVESGRALEFAELALVLDEDRARVRGIAVLPEAAD